MKRPNEEDRGPGSDPARPVPAIQQPPGIRAARGWNPNRRPPRHAGRPVPRGHLSARHLDGDRAPESWELVSIRTAPDLGHVRHGMTYGRDITTSAALYEKTGRTQFMEGPNEPAVGDHLEMCPRYLAFQFQPMDLTFRRADGRIIHRYPDVAVEFEDHRVGVGEIKSSAAWFQAPAIKRPLDRIDLALAAHAIAPLMRIPGEPFRADAVLEAHALAMDARLTKYDREDEAKAVRAVIGTGGGTTTHADLVNLLGGGSLAADKLYAMMLDRVVSFDLSAPPVPTTAVTAPRVAKPWALKELLSKFRPPEAA